MELVAVPRLQEQLTNTPLQTRTFSRGLRDRQPWTQLAGGDPSVHPAKPPLALLCSRTWDLVQGLNLLPNARQATGPRNPRPPGAP